MGIFKTITYNYRLPETLYRLSPNAGGITKKGLMAPLLFTRFYRTWIQEPGQRAAPMQKQAVAAILSLSTDS